MAMLAMSLLPSVAAEAWTGVEENLEGAYLKQLQERDSVLVADQLEYGICLDGIPEGTALAFPDLSGGFADSVEVLTPWKIDTLKIHKGKKGNPATYDIKGSVVITSFDEGSYELPPVPVLRRSPSGEVDTLVFKPMHLEVKTMPVDTSSFQIHDIKGQVRYPLTFREIFPYLFGGEVALLLIILAVCLVIMRRRQGGISTMHKEPAHILALRKLDHLRGSKLWAAEKQKSFYSGVTDALREYMASRYGISAMEMTSKEIFDGLSGQDIPKDLFAETRSLFERADYVKFAKYVASDDENAAAVPVAVRFVTQTYQSELDSDMQDKGKTEETSGQEHAQEPCDVQKKD